MDIRGHNGTNLTAPFWQGWAGLCILTALLVCASSTQLLEGYQVKTTLAFMVNLKPRSAAHRQTTLLLSGVLEVILKTK